MSNRESKIVWMLTEKKQLLARYQELTGAQEKLIADEDTDGLLQNIDERQQVIDQLEVLEEKLRRERTESGSWLGGETRAITELQQEIRGLGKSIQEQDRQIKSAAVEKRDFFSAEIRKLRTKRRGLVEYTKSGYETYITSSKFDKMQ